MGMDVRLAEERARQERWKRERDRDMLKLRSTKACDCCKGRQEIAPGCICPHCGGRGYTLSAAT